MNSNLNAARLLTAWTDLLGSKLPKKLTEAAAALEAAEYAQGPAVTFDTGSVTPANAEAKVLQLATDLATSEQFALARGKAAEALGRHVLAVAGEVAPDVFAQLTPRLKAAAESLRAALDALPNNPTPESIIGDAASVAAWNAAHGAIAELDTLDRFAASLSAVYGHQGEVTLRLLTPTTRAAYQTLLRAKDTQGALRPLWVAGVTTPDVTFTLNDPAQSLGIAQALNALPPTERKAAQFIRVGR